MAYSGRLSPEKNLGLLIDAFASVASAVPDAQLAFIGDGPEREALEDAVAERHLSRRVRFVGMVPYEEMPAQLAARDLWVTGSTTEVDPLTVIEALAAGLPVVGPAAPGIVDTVEDGVTGILVRPNDAPSLADGIARLCLDGELRRRMGTAARGASRRYSIEATGAEMLAIYEEVVRGHEFHTAEAPTA